jgi:hypothetical protein
VIIKGYNIWHSIKKIVWWWQLTTQDYQ